MDKENKYYGIIENLVRNHKKFSGLETIIDDIIDDVYTHSQAIIESINDENVIDAYLNKVVSTSIITVPKKLGFHSESHNRSQLYTQPVKTLEQIVQEQEQQKTQENEEEKIETSVETSVEISVETTLDEPEHIQGEIIQEDDESLASLVTEELPVEEESFEFDAETETETMEELQEVEEKSTSNNDLVDKMINSITEDTLKENGLSEDDLEDMSPEAVNDISEDSGTIEEQVNYSDVSTVDNLNDLQVEDTDEIEDANALDLVEDDSDLEITENIFTDEEDGESEDIIQELEQEDSSDGILDEAAEEDTNSEYEFLENSEDDNSMEMLELSEPEFDDEQIGFEGAALEEENDLFSVADDEQGLMEEEPELTMSEDSIGFGDDTEEQLLEADNEYDIALEGEAVDSDLTISEDETESAENIEFKPVNYSAFEYTPDGKENYYENDDIAAKLLEIDKQEPDLNILKIFDLKYKHNLTIEEIMAELNLEKQDIIAALDKMVELI